MILKYESWLVGHTHSTSTNQSFSSNIQQTFFKCHHQQINKQKRYSSIFARLCIFSLHPHFPYSHQKRTFLILARLNPIPYHQTSASKCVYCQRTHESGNEKSPIHFQKLQRCSTFIQRHDYLTCTTICHYQLSSCLRHQHSKNP